MNREAIMKQWDTWRKYIADGGKASWPRDAFETLLDDFEQSDKIIELLEKIEENTKPNPTPSYVWNGTIKDIQYDWRYPDGGFISVLPDPPSSTVAEYNPWTLPPESSGGIYYHPEYNKDITAGGFGYSDYDQSH